MKSSSASFSKKKKLLIGALTPAVALCLSAGLILMSATEEFTRTAYAATGFNNIVNANIGMHPKWELDTCATVDEGGVGDTYTSAHKIWRVTTDKTNDPVMEKSPSYVFQGNETNAAELAATYSLRKGNEVVFNITEEDSAAKVWADAIAFAQSVGKERALVDETEENDLANCAGNTQSSGDGSHNGWRVGSNIGKRNHYKGNFFLENTDGSIGQYITVRLQTDWKAKDITANIPQNVTKTKENSKGDYYITIDGDTKPLQTTTFDYIKTDLQAKNGNYLVKGTGTTNYLESLGDKTDFNDVTNFNCITTNGDYTLSYDLASNGFDYDVCNFDTKEEDPNARNSKRALDVFNDYCAFSFGRLHIPTGVYIVLDLNGHTIDRNLAGKDTSENDKGDYYGSVISVSNVARLEVMDSTAYENASSARIETKDGGAYKTNHGGTITGGHIIGAEKEFNAAPYAKNAAFPNDMRLKYQEMGGAVNIAPWGDFVMDSGTIMGNRVTGPENGSIDGGSGGAFYQRSKGAVTIFDGYVIDNHAANKGGVTILGNGSGCAFTMYGGVLGHNTSGYLGGAVQLGTSTYANFHGGEIVNNTTGARGGAINLFGNTLGILDSVTITGNKVTSDVKPSDEVNAKEDGGHTNGHGGAIYVDEATNSIDAYRNDPSRTLGAGFRFRGSLQIYGNKVGKDEKEENVYLSYSDKSTGNVTISGGPSTPYIPGFAKIAIGGPMIANGIVAKVGVTLGKYDAAATANNVFTSEYGQNGNGAVDAFLYFHSDDDQYAVVNNGENASREATLGQASAVHDDGGLTWLIEGTGTDADTDIEKGESTLKIVLNSSGAPTFYYKNPNNAHGLDTTLTKVTDGSQMNTSVKLTKEERSTNKLLEVLKDRFTYSSGTLDFEYSMLKVTRISVYKSGTTFDIAGDDLTATSDALAEWKSAPAGGDKNYNITNTFDNANFHFKLGDADLTAAKNNVSDEMQKAIGATDGCISYAGEYSVLLSGARYTNPSFKIKINQVGVEVDRSLYYDGKNIETYWQWLKDIDWDGSGQTAVSGSEAKLGNEVNQPYFIYSGDYYYPILNADYDRLDVFNLYNPFTGDYHTVAKGAFTGYVLEFTYANEYFGTNQPVQFGSHSGGGIEYQTMHRQPGEIDGIGTYVSGVKNAGMYSVQFISSRSAASAEQGDADHDATGVYFAANNFAFSSKLNIYVDPASAEVELTDQAKLGFTYDAGELKDEEIVIYDNTSNTHVNPHLDSAAVLEYYLFDDLKFKAGIYDVRTELYYTLDQIANWENIRPWGKVADKDDATRKAEAEKAGHPYFPSYPDGQLKTAPEVKWKEGGTFNPSKPGDHITGGDDNGTNDILSTEGLIEFQTLYERETDPTSNGKLVYIVDGSSFDLADGAKKLDGKPIDARRYAVFVALDLDAGYDDYNYKFDQDADHLVGLDNGTGYFWAFEFTVNPAAVRPYDFDTEEVVPAIPDEGGKNTSVSVQREVVFNGLGQFQLPDLTFTDPLGVKRPLLGSAAKFADGSAAFKEGLYKDAPFTVLDSGYDFVVKYYIEEYGLKDEDGQYLDYVNVMGGKTLKVRIYIPAYKVYNEAEKTWTATGANGNYTFDGTALGDALKDDGGNYYYEIEYEITPVTVTTSLTVTYTYDGTSREEKYDPSLYTQDQTKYPEQGGKVGQGVGGVYATTRPALAANRQQGFIYPFSMVKDSGSDTAHGTEVGPVVGKDKLKYTISNPTWVFSNEDYQKNTNITFGSGVYAFNTGNPNVGQYVLNTATELTGGDPLKTHQNKDPLDIGAGVVWVFAFANSNDTDNRNSRQGFNGTADENGNYGNFVVGPESHVTVIIEKKDIADDNVFATRIQQAKDGDSLSDGAKEHGALTVESDGYADVAYKSDDGAVVQDTDATDGKYKMATFPFAGATTFYRPHVKLNYYKYGVNGTTEKTARGAAVEELKENTDFTLGWADNNMVSVTSETAGISGVAAGSFASVIVNAQGNYTGSVSVNFYIRPAIIEITHDGSAYDFTKGAEPEHAEFNGYYFDRGSHAIQLTYTNTEDYASYEGILCNARGAVLNGTQIAGLETSANIDITSVAYAYASQELFDAFYKKYFGDEHVDDHELEELNKLYSTSAPVDADVYYVAIALSNENFVFKQAAEGENFPSITGSNFGNGVSNNLVRGTFEIKPATVTATLVGTGKEYYNRNAHTASFTFRNDRYGQGDTEVPSDALGEYTVTYQCGAAVHDSEEGMVDAGKYTVTVTVGMHAWFNEGNITADMKTGVDIPEPTRSNFLFNATADETRTFDFEIMPAEIKLDKFADVAYNKAGQPVPLGFSNTERNNEAVPTLADADADDTVTENEYAVTYATTSANAKLDGSSVPLNAGSYKVTVALTDAAKSEENASLYNFKFILTAGTDQTVDGDGKTISSSYTVTPATVNASVARTSLTYNGEEQKQTVDFENALDEDTIVPTVSGDDVNADGVEYSVKYTYSGFASPYTGFTNRGSYSITVTLKTDGNYTFGKRGDEYLYTYDLSYSIQPKNIADADVTLSETPDTIVYTGDSLTPDFTLTATAIKGGYSLVADEDYYVTHSRDVNVYYSEASEQTVVNVTINGQNNFIGTKKFTFTIVPAEVSVTANEGTPAGGTIKLPYNKFPQSLDFVFTNGKDGDVVPLLGRNADLSNYTVTYRNRDVSDGKVYTQTDAPANAGTYDVTVTLGKNEKGNFTFEGGAHTATFTLEITPAELTLTITESFAEGSEFVKSFVYDGKEYYSRLKGFTLDNTENNIVPNSSAVTEDFYLGAHPDGTKQASGFKNAAGYYILFTFTKENNVDKNYAVTEICAGSATLASGSDYTVQDDGSIVIPFTITPAEVSLNAPSSKTYTGGNLTADIFFTNTSDGSDVVPANYNVTYSGGTAKDAYVVDAGTYDVTVALEGEDATNFDLADGSTEFTVDPAIVSAKVDATQFTYDGQAHRQTVTFANSYGEGAVTPTREEVEYTLTYRYDGFSEQEYGAFTDRGFYSISVDLTKNGNFAFGKDESGYNYHYDILYSILPKEITKDEVSGISEGEHKTYTGESLTPTVTIETTLGTGVYTLKDADYAVAHTPDVDAYNTRGEQNQVTVTISGQNNFSGTLVYHFTIDPAKVSVTADNETRPGGEYKTPYNKYPQSLAFAFENGVNEDVVPVFNSNERSTHYTVSYKNRDLSDGETYTQTRAPINAGTYDVTVTLKEHGNFTFEDESLTKSFTLVIERAQLTLTISESFAEGSEFVKSFVYDGRDYCSRLNNFKLDNANNTVPVSSEVTEAFYLGIYPAGDGGALAKFTDAGKYYILFAFKTEAIGKNYEVVAIYAGSSADGAKLENETDYSVEEGGSIVIPFEITPARITVNELVKKTYTGDEITADISFTNQSEENGVVPTDYTVNYGDSGDHVVDAGEYTVTVTLEGGDATNFEIVAWDGADTETRQFIVDPAKLTVALAESVVNYSGSNYTVRANFTNTSETEIVPTNIDVDYSLTLAATDESGITPAYNEVIDAKTYHVTVTLLDDNFVFTEGGMETVLNYTINAGTITLSALGETLAESWEKVSYNPDNPIETKFGKEYFTLVGSRSSDLENMTITSVSCTASGGGEYTQKDGYYEIAKKGNYEVVIQVSAPNHTTQTFTFNIHVDGDDVLINVPGEFASFLVASYGDEFSEEELKTKFLKLIIDGDLTVVNIPDPDLEGMTSGASVVDWLNKFGFTVTVSVDRDDYSTSGHLKAGDYALTVSLPEVDGGIRFHEISDAQVATSHTRFYRITPVTIEIDWGALAGLKYSGRDQSASIKSGVKIANLLDGDQVRFEPGHITIGTKNGTFSEADEVVDAVKAGTQDLIQYFLRLHVDEATLRGDDSANYVFSDKDRVDGEYFEKDFTIARLGLTILLTDSTSYYGNDYTENFRFTHSDMSGSADVDVDEGKLREAVLSVLKLYLADIPVDAKNPGVNDNYQVKATTTSSDFGNFELEFQTAVAKHTITPRPVTLQMASSESIYGENVVLPGPEDAWMTAAGSLEVLPDDLEAIRNAIVITTDATSTSPVRGAYTTSGEVRPNAASGNYTITCVPGVYTVRPRPIVIDITNRHSVYGERLDDNLTAPDAWKISTSINHDAGAGYLNYGLRSGDSLASLGVVLSLNLTYSDYLACNRDAEGNIIAWPNAISGSSTNENYEVTAWINGEYMVNPRKVNIVIRDRTAVYGDDLAHVGSLLALTAPEMNVENNRVIKEGDWTYDSTLGSGTYAILPVDLTYLTFYVGKADAMSQSAYAYVGSYPLVGAWAFGFDGSSVSYCYDISFTGSWAASLNPDATFEGTQDNAAGVYEIRPASIREEGRWNVNKFFYETSNPEKTEENGWFKMFLEQMLFSLKGDFNAPLSDITFTDFAYSAEDSVAGSTTAFKTTLRINGKDETLTLIFAKPVYSGIGKPTDEEPYYNEADHLWYVHTAGQWTSAVTVSVANHDEATFTLTYTVANVVATVSLNATIGALEAEYGDYEYLALGADLGNYNENDIKDLPLSKALNEYIFENRLMIISVTGFDAAFPEWTDAEATAAIIDNCWVEVADAKISSSGYLMAGSYTLRLVARLGSGFVANFKTSSSVLPEGQVDQGAGNRLVIRPRGIGIDWVDPDTAKSDEIIREESDKITYTYSGYAYSQQPTFTNLLPGDVVSDPAYTFLTETGAAVDVAKNVRKDGYYTICVSQSAIEGVDSTNYRLPADMTIRLDIIPREIYITIDDLESTVYGVEPDLDRTFTTDDWHVSADKGLGLAAGETANDLMVELRLELFSKNAALYENAVKGEGNNGNYEFHFEGGNYEITRKPIHITIEDKKSFYGDDLVSLGFTVDDALGYKDTADDLLVTLTKAPGLDVGGYAITGESENLNYIVTFTDGTYTIEQATNVWLREFQTLEFLEGESPTEEQKPLSRFGNVHLHYFRDEACTDEITIDDISELEDGVYYVRAIVDGTDNYTPLNDLYTITILPTYTAFGKDMDIGLYLTIWSVQVIALLGAVLFIRRRKHKKGTKKS